jgi:outer membrane protein assembly factor BamB
MMITLPNRKVLVTHTENSILGIDAADGKLLWRHDQPNKYSVHANTPLYHGGFLYCVSGYGQGGVMLKIAPDGSAKQEIWRNASLDHRMGGFVLINDRIYGSDDSNKAWWCLDWKTGKEIYSEKITNKGTIIYADGMLYCYGDNGEIALVQPMPDGFKKISSFKVPYGSNQHWAHPVIVKGKLYVRHGNSLMVYDVRQR